MLNISTHQFHVFLEAAESLNFTQAAQRLQMTQPSVSQHIQALEEHFGLPLFVRLGRSLELTEAGQALLPMAREMVLLATQIDESMASLKGDVLGHLTVGCSTCAGRYLLPKLLASFHQMNPGIKTTCQVAPYTQVIQMLLEGKVQLALTSHSQTGAEIEFLPFTREQLVLAAPLSHPWAAQSSIGLEDLCKADFILPEPESEVYEVIQDALGRYNLSIFDLKTQVFLGSPETILLSIQEGLGVGFVPEVVLQRLAPSEVTVIPVREFQIEREIYLGRDTRRKPSQAQKSFWEMVCPPQVEISSPLSTRTAKLTGSLTDRDQERVL